MSRAIKHLFWFIERDTSNPPRAPVLKHKCLGALRDAKMSRSPQRLISTIHFECWKVASITLGSHFSMPDWNVSHALLLLSPPKRFCVFPSTKLHKSTITTLGSSAFSSLPSRMERNPHPLAFPYFRWALKGNPEPRALNAKDFYFYFIFCFVALAINKTRHLLMAAIIFSCKRFVQQASCIL